MDLLSDSLISEIRGGDTILSKSGTILWNVFHLALQKLERILKKHVPGEHLKINQGFLC